MTKLINLFSNIRLIFSIKAIKPIDKVGKMWYYISIPTKQIGDIEMHKLFYDLLRENFRFGRMC